MNDIKKLDLYELLSVSMDSTEQEIKKSYRRLALSCHPDKNPDNPQAIERFHQLSKALEILTDSTAKDAYDRLLKARKATIIRHRKLDQKRQKLKDQLEARERAAKEETLSEAEATDRLNREIERLRKEGSKQLEAENEILRQKIEEEIKQLSQIRLNKSKLMPKIKVIKKSKTFEFTDQNLRQYFKDFGEIDCLVLTKNNKRALIEFTDYNQTLNAYESRDQFRDVSIELIGDIPEDNRNESQTKDLSNDKTSEQSIDSNIFEKPIYSTDYESLVLMNLRRAEERKQLIKQMEDNKDN